MNRPNCSFDSPFYGPPLKFKDDEQRQKRRAEFNLKSLLAQSVVSLLCFVEFYITPFDVYKENRTKYRHSIMALSGIFCAGAVVSLIWYLIYLKKAANLASNKAKFERLLHKQESFLEAEENKSHMNNSFSCVRLSNSLSNSPPSLNESSSGFVKRHGLNNSATSTLSTPGRSSQSFSGNTSLNLSSSRIETGFGASNKSFTLRPRNSIRASAEQSFHLSPLTSPKMSPLESSPPNTKWSERSSTDDANISYGAELQQYLKSFYTQEVQTLAALETFRQLGESPAARFLKHLPNDKYQLSSQSPTLDNNSEVTSLSPLKGSATFSAQVMSMHGIDEGEKIQHWVEKLRKWMSATILKPLVKAIGDANRQLEQAGVTEVRLGKSNISSFALIRQQQQQSQNMKLDILEKVIPYLDMSSNQEYLLERLQTLAEDSCIARFCFKGGAAFKGEPWNESLPSDADIILHVFFTYLDQHSTSHASFVAENRIKSLYFMPLSLLKQQKSLKNNRRILLGQVSSKPPTFAVIFREKTLHVPQGAYNLFHAILLFAFLHDRHNFGKLEAVSLGSAGINLSWIFSL